MDRFLLAMETDDEFLPFRCFSVEIKGIAKTVENVK